MAAAEWHVSRQGRQYGPYSWEQLLSMAGAGQILPADLVWGPGLAAWTRADQVRGLPWPRPAAAPTPPPQAARPSPPPQAARPTSPPPGVRPSPPPASPNRTGTPSAATPGPAVTLPAAAPGAGSAGTPRTGGGRTLRACLAVAVIGIVLVLAAGGGYLLWRYKPWQSKAEPPPAESRFPLVEYTEEKFDTQAVVPPDTTPETSGTVELRLGGTTAATLADGTEFALPGLADGDSVRLTLERRTNDIAPGLEGVQTTGGMRVLTLDAAQLADPAAAFARLVPRIVLPAREIGSLAPETVLLARQGLRVVEGQGVVDRVDFLPVVRDDAGNLVARDIWLPASPLVLGLPEGVSQGASRRPADALAWLSLPGNGGRPLAMAFFMPVLGAPAAPNPSARNVIKYSAATYQQSINWNRQPQLVRMVPHPSDPARRQPLYRLSKWDQAQELAKPVQNVFVLVHGRNEMEKSGLGTPPQISDPWWYAYKQDVWTNFYRIFQTDHKDMLGSTVFFEFIYPSFRPVFQGNGPTAEFLDRLIREQLKKQLDLKQSFNLFIVAHSMGGVVSRAGVQHFDGTLADNFRHLATWGSPHLGSPLVSLNYMLISPYHKLEVTGPDLSGDWRKRLLGSILITDNPGTQDLRWTNGNAGYRSELVFDRMGFTYDADYIGKHFPSAAAADPVVNLRSGSFLYSENLRQLNAADKYAGTDTYIFLYGVTAKGVDLEWTGGVFDKGFEAEAVARQSEIGLGATTLWLLVENPATPYLGVPQGHGDGAVPILSMTGHGLGGKTVALGECDHEEYFGAPDAPGHFTVQGKASVTARRTLSELGIGSVERYNPPEIRLKLQREEDVKALLAGDLDGDLEIEGELVWPGDPQPAQRILPGKVEAFVTRKGSRSREPVEARNLALESGGRFRAGLYVRDLKNSGLDRKTDLELCLRLFFKDDTELESEPLLLTGQEVLRGSFLGTIRATSVNREYLLNRFIEPGSDDLTLRRNESNRDLNRLYLQNLEWAGLNKESGLTFSIFSVAENSGEADQIEGKYFVDLIFRGPRLIPNDFRPYKDKRNGEVTLILTANTFELVQKRETQTYGRPASMIYKVNGTLRGDTLNGSWSITENGTQTFAGTYTAKRM